MAWNAALYLRFASERLRPALDLLAQVRNEPSSVRRVCDLGCGAGNVTTVLADRFSGSSSGGAVHDLDDAAATATAPLEILGIDTSQNMLDKAVANFAEYKAALASTKRLSPADAPRATFEQNDVLTFAQRFSGVPAVSSSSSSSTTVVVDDDERFDLIYSNAVLHWVDEHDVVLPLLMACLRERGTLAVQMPSTALQESHMCMDRALRSLRDSDAADADVRARIDAFFAGTSTTRKTSDGVLTTSEYYDLLTPVSSALDIWETLYTHRMASVEEICNWTKATGLIPYRELVGGESSDAYAEFLRLYVRHLGEAYPVQRDGSVLLQFRRVFLVATAPRT